MLPFKGLIGLRETKWKNHRAGTAEAMSMKFRQ